MNQHWFVSRRELLKRVGGAGAAAVMAPGLVPAAPAGAATPLAQATPAAGDSLATLTAAEAGILEAITARLIPTDRNGPGAVEARAARYIDRALGGALSPFRDAYRTGLAAVDRYAQSAKGTSFLQLPADDQDGVLGDIERGVATGFTPSAPAFFALMLAHTIQGTFCDPYYGGNANFAGWDLIGYPGVRLAVTAGEQALDARPSPTHMSAYDYRMFAGSRPARAVLERPGDRHGF